VAGRFVLDGGCLALGVGTMRRILVVANRTLGGEFLLEAIKARVTAGPCEFTLLVPAYAARQGRGADSSSEGAARSGRSKLQGEDLWLPAERDYSQAHQRLEYGLDQFRRVGATVNGDVVGSNVLGAIGDALRVHEIDEIILSTLPSGVSRWLHQDLPHRVERKFRRPVTVITPP
jgi:hypothetical protein